jgi:hypothetical protein
MKKQLPRYRRDIYEVYLMANSPWIGVIRGVSSRHRKLLCSLKSLLSMADHMVGHRKGRVLRERLRDRLMKLDPQTRDRFMVALGLKKPETLLLGKKRSNRPIR